MTRNDPERHKMTRNGMTCTVTRCDTSTVTWHGAARNELERCNASVGVAPATSLWGSVEYRSTPAMLLDAYSLTLPAVRV